MYGIKWKNKTTDYVDQGSCVYTEYKVQEFCDIYNTMYSDIKYEVISDKEDIIC